MSSSDEKARRAALRRYAVLDTPPEAPFDRIARLAARWFDAPIALITFVDEGRQWVKASVGFGRDETDLDRSFCVYTIRDEGVMVVEDATQDERFADNPLVTGNPGVRFYAGAPLITPDGYRIGSVCVMDTTPRTLDDPSSRETLQDLADMAMDQLQARLAHPHHTDVLESITDAFFALDDAWQFTYLNEQAEALLQRPRDELLGRSVWDEFPDAVELDFYEQYHQATRTGERVTFEAYFPPLETWFQVNAYPFEDGLSVFFDDITDRRAAEETLREREEYLAVMLRSIGDAVVATDTEGRVTEMNPIAERLTGWPLHEAAGRPLADIFRIENAKTGAPVESPVQTVLEEGRIVGLANHTMLTARDGTQRQIADSAAPIRNDDGDLLGVVMVFRDVTDTYQQEEALRAERDLLAGIFDTSAAAITVLDADGQIIRANERAEEVLGLAVSRVEGRTYDDPGWKHAAVDGGPFADEEQPFARVMATEAPVYDVQHAIEWPDGRRRILSINGAPLHGEDDAVTGAVFIVDDITEQKKRERALRDERQRLELALIGGNLGLWDLNMDAGTNVINEQWASMLGYTVEEVGDSQAFFEDHVHPDDLERAYAQMERHAQGDIPHIDVEIRMRHKDGSWRWILDRGKIVEWNEDGTPHRAVGTHLDITEKKRREQALRESRRLLKESQRVAHLGHWDWDVETGAIHWSDETYRIFGYEPGAFDPTTTTYFEAIPEPDRQRIEALNQRSIEAGYMEPVEHPIVRPDGSERVVELSGVIMQGGEEGPPTRVVGTVLDITERKKREEALRRQRDLLDQAQRLAGAWEYDAESGRIDLSEESRQVLGWDPDKPPRFGEMDHLFSPEGLSTLRAAIRTAIQEGAPYDVEVRLATQTGPPRWVRAVGSAIEDENGEVVKLAGALQDITERKTAEQALTRSLAEKQRILETTLDGYMLHDVNGTIVEVNPAYCQMVGYDRDALIGMDIRDLDVGFTSEVLDQRIQNDPEVENYRFETQHVHRDGHRVDLDVSAAMMENDRGERLVNAFIRDITARKKAEDALRASEERWRTLVESHPDPIHITVDGRYAYINPSGARLFGVDHPSDMIGRSVFDFVAEETKDRLQQRKAQLERGEATEPFEHTMVRLDGKERIVVARSIPITYKGQDAAQTVIRDVTERRRAEEALRESEQRYRTLVERSHDAIYIYRDTRLLFVNRRVEKLTGYAEDELFSMDVLELVHPEDRERVRQHARGRADGTAPNRYEARILRKDGSVRYADFSVQAITYQGEPAGIGSIRDVTEQRRAEEALRESEQRFRALAEETTDLVTRHAPDGTYLYASPSAKDLLGYAPEDLVGTTFQPIVHPDDLDRVEAHIAEAQQGGQKVQFEYRAQHADGHYLWVETAGQHVPGDGGAATLIASTRSVDERKAAEEALVRREQRVEALYEAMRGLTEARTHEQVAEHILTLIDDTLGYPISAVRYQNEEGVLVPAAVSGTSRALMPDRPSYDVAADSLVALAFRRGETMHYDDVQALDLSYDLGVVRACAYVPIRSHGTISVGSLHVGAIDEFDLKLIEILARNADGVIERINREDALRAARDEAEEMNRLKSAFLANMSHEIRTPLTSIIGFSEVLGEQDLGEASRFAHLIQRGGQRLLDTLNSVLDLSQLEAGSMQLAPKDINVGQEVEGAASFFTPRAEKDDVALHVHLPSDPVEAHLDASAVQRILNNLLGNAVKFTPAGGRIDVRLRAPADYVVIEVDDTGVGIDQDFLPHLFDAFQQESTGNARTFEGSGLGLAITHQLVQLMGGTIDVTTGKGEGTCFTVRLPRHLPA
jgi:PAS domain S-box-containing protein